MSIITIVDDNAAARHFLSTALAKSGHDLMEIEPGCLYEVLQALHKVPPDLLVTNLAARNCPGQTLIRACREDSHLKHLRILLLTANGDGALARFIQSMGNVHYLAKPVSRSMFQDCVEFLLNQEAETDSGWSLACNGVVAVVDDSLMSRALHSACLRRQGFRCIQVEPTDLLETVLALEAIQPDLLLVDFLMPGFRGDALIRALRGRETLREVPVLVVTAHRSDEVIHQLLPIGGVAVAFKPIAPEDLMVHVWSMLGRELPQPVGPEGAGRPAAS